MSLIDRETPVLLVCPGVAPPRVGREATHGLTGEKVVLVVSDGHEVGGVESIDRVSIRFESGRILTLRVRLDGEFEHTLDVSDARF